MEARFRKDPDNKYPEKTHVQPDQLSVLRQQRSWRGIGSSPETRPRMEAVVLEGPDGAKDVGVAQEIAAAEVSAMTSKL